MEVSIVRDHAAGFVRYNIENVKNSTKERLKDNELKELENNLN